MASRALEELPVELKVHVLHSIPDLPTLRNLVLASPDYHRVYLAWRSSILLGLLKQQYERDHVDIADAVAAIRSKDLSADVLGNKDRIVAFLKARRHGQDVSTDRPVNLEEIIKLLRLHEASIYFLNEYSLHAPRPAWIDLTKWLTELLPLRLSDTEKGRFLRAFYHLETYCNIFGAPELSEAEANHYGNHEMGVAIDIYYEICPLFVATMAPWEVEEFSCVWTYLRSRWGPVLRQVYEGLAKHGSQRIPGIENYGVQDLLPWGSRNRHLLDTMGLLPPSFLYKVLRQRSYKISQELVIINMRDFRFPMTTYLYSSQGYNRAPALQPTNPIDTEQPTSVLLQRPNLGWFQQWARANSGAAVVAGGTRAIRNHMGWLWGYAIWDGKRLTEWKAPLLEG